MQSARATASLLRSLIAALAFALTLAFAFAPSLAHAAGNPKTNRDQAIELFKQSRKRYESGDFTGAIELLERAYALEPSPVLQFNLGRAYESAGQLDKAIDAYKKYLELDPKAKDRGAIEQRIDTLERQLADRAHLARERDEAAQRAKKAENERDSPKTDASGESSPSSPTRPKIAPIIGIAAGAAVLTTGAVFGYLSRKKSDQAQDASTSGKQADDDQASAKRFATIANIGFIAGGMLVAGGATWLIIGSSSKESAGQVSLGLMPNGARVSGKF